jgi:broad specificity phosphatase PhoE
MRSIRRIGCALALAVTTMLPLTASAEVTMIYLTRHAEKASETGDPALTAEGLVRAQNIAAVLKKAKIAQIYSTNYVRTKQTAQPLSTALTLPVQTYDPRQQAAFAKQVLALKGNTLIVGHSNTIPDMVRQLGGDPGSDIPDSEFNRLYQLTIEKDGSVTTTLLNSQP